MKAFMVKWACRLSKGLCGGLLAYAALTVTAQAASCVSAGSPLWFTAAPPGTLPVPRDVAVGQVLWDSGWKSGSGITFNCQAGTQYWSGYTFSLSSVPGLVDVYASAVPGIGIRASWIPAMTVGSWIIDMTSPTSYFDTSPPNVPGQFGPMPLMRLQLVATGKVSAGTLPGTTLANAYFGGAIVGQIAMTSVNVVPQTCSVTTKSVAVNMPVAKGSALPSPGSTTGATNFNIGLSCPAGIKLAMTITDAVNSSNTSNVLSLTGTSTAKGVGYQMLYNGNVVSYGADSAVAGNANQFVVSSSTSSGSLTVPLTTRYIRTGTVVAGSAHSLATFTMSYQ